MVGWCRWVVGWGMFWVRYTDRYCCRCCRFRSRSDSCCSCCSCGKRSLMERILSVTKILKFQYHYSYSTRSSATTRRSAMTRSSATLVLGKTFKYRFNYTMSHQYKIQYRNLECWCSVPPSYTRQEITATSVR